MAAKIKQLKELREKMNGVLEIFRSDKRLVPTFLKFFCFSYFSPPVIYIYIVYEF